MRFRGGQGTPIHFFGTRMGKRYSPIDWITTRGQPRVSHTALLVYELNFITSNQGVGVILHTLGPYVCHRKYERERAIRLVESSTLKTRNRLRVHRYRCDYSMDFTSSRKCGQLIIYALS